MQLKISCNQEELQENKQTVDEQIQQWAAEKEHFDEFSTEVESGLLVWVKKAEQLKMPLNFLYGLAKTFKLEFAVSLEEENGGWEEVCYFGHEEGKPDVFEISCYTGLSA